jgi:hypothetical protein
MASLATITAAENKARDFFGLGPVVTTAAHDLRMAAHYELEALRFEANGFGSMAADYRTLAADYRRRAGQPSNT